jgi:hypothetical protein
MSAARVSRVVRSVEALATEPSLRGLVELLALGEDPHDDAAR